MKSIQFRPLLWPTLFSIVSFLVLISLGTWQVKRLFWKNNIISNYTEKFEKNKILYEKSFKYPFDSLQTLSILTPEDKSFRIFNWILSGSWV